MGEKSNVECAIEGWKSIAAMFNVQLRVMMRRKKELSDAGVIFYMVRGKPKRKVVCAFPSLLKAWISIKSAKGENF